MIDCCMSFAKGTCLFDFFFVVVGLREIVCLNHFVFFNTKKLWDRIPLTFGSYFPRCDFCSTFCSQPEMKCLSIVPIAGGLAFLTISVPILVELKAYYRLHVHIVCFKCITVLLTDFCLYAIISQQA